jgi:hypothetical protein
MNIKKTTIAPFMTLFIIYTIVSIALNFGNFIYFKPTEFNGYISIGNIIVWMMLSFAFGINKNNSFIWVSSAVWLTFIIFYVASQNFNGFDLVIIPTVILITPLYGISYFLQIGSLSWVDKTAILIGFQFFPTLICYFIGKRL